MSYRGDLGATGWVIGRFIYEVARWPRDAAGWRDWNIRNARRIDNQIRRMLDDINRKMAVIRPMPYFDAYDEDRSYFRDRLLVHYSTLMRVTMGNFSYWVSSDI